MPWQPAAALPCCHSPMLAAGSVLARAVPARAGARSCSCQGCPPAAAGWPAAATMGACLLHREQRTTHHTPLKHSTHEGGWRAAAGSERMAWGWGECPADRAGRGGAGPAPWQRRRACKQEVSPPLRVPGQARLGLPLAGGCAGGWAWSAGQAAERRPVAAAGAKPLPPECRSSMMLASWACCQWAGSAQLVGAGIGQLGKQCSAAAAAAASGCRTAICCPPRAWPGHRAGSPMGESRRLLCRGMRQMARRPQRIPDGVLTHPSMRVYFSAGYNYL